MLHNLIEWVFPLKVSKVYWLDFYHWTKDESNVHVCKTIGSDVNRPHDWIFKQVFVTNSVQQQPLLLPAG